MVGDGICDELANIEKCLYDGGDCCLEVKSTQECQDCRCKMKVDEKELEELFVYLDVQMITDETYPTEIAAVFKRVIDVQSSGICFYLCQDHSGLRNQINAWSYDNGTCKCARLPDTDVCNDNIRFSSKTKTDLQTGRVAYVIMSKNLPCGTKTTKKFHV